jgi:ATP-dependent DNA helicase RecG
MCTASTYLVSYVYQFNKEINMSIDIATINDSQLAELLNLQESHFYDAKSKQIRPSKMSRTVSGFANANGGELYIGLEEREGPLLGYDWKGFDSPEEANAHIQVCEQLFPLGRFFQYQFLKHLRMPGLVLHITVGKTRDIKEASSGKSYIRRGAQNLPVNSTEMKRRLELDKGIASFEDETVPIDHQVVTNSEVVLRFMLNVIPTAEPKTWLEKQWLLRSGGPTVAAVLLFSDLPQAVLPKRSGIKIYRYKTSDKAGRRETLAFDPLTIEGCAYDQIRSAVEKTVDLVEDIKVLGPEGFEPVEYPHEALHEIITNAVIHRDYSIATDVHIRIYDNRIEIESPGLLPGHITRENILTEQFARNASLVRIINKFPNPPNKDVGEGLNTAFEAMRKLRLKDPTIGETAHSVVVIISHETLASPEELVIDYLESHDEIQNRDARKITGITSENTMKNVFYRLRDSGLIERVPGKKGAASAWRKCADDQP